MLHHVEIYVLDLARTHVFWAWLAPHLGYKAGGNWAEGFTIEGQGAYLTFVQVEPRHMEHRYHRSGIGVNHLAFTLPTRAAVDALRGEILARGVALLYDQRYPFANGGSRYFALYFEDPDRMKIEVVAHDS